MGRAKLQRGLLIPVVKRRGAAWTPLQAVGGLLPVRWYKSDTLVANDGDMIATWVDQSTTGDNAVQATDLNKPTYQKDAADKIGTLPVVRFDGSNDFFSITQLSLNDYSIFYVAKPKAEFTGLIGHSNTQNGIYQYGASGQFMRFRYGAATNMDVAIGNHTYNTARIWSFGRSGTTTSVRVNGSNKASFGAGDYVNAGTAFLVNRLALVIGAFGNVDAAELLIYAGSMTDANKLIVEQYLSTRSGIPLA